MTTQSGTATKRILIAADDPVIEKLNFEPLAGAPEIVGVAVDLAVLAGSERVQMDGEPDLIVELIDLYVEDAPRRVIGMQESLAKRNWIS